MAPDQWLARSSEGGGWVYCIDHRGDDWRMSVIHAHRFSSASLAKKAAQAHGRDGEVIHVDVALGEEWLRLAGLDEVRA